MDILSLDPKIIAALIGVIGTFFGMLIGYGIQSMSNFYAQRNERLSLLKYGYELILNVRHTAIEYSDPEKIMDNSLSSIVIPKVLKKEIDYYLEWSRKIDPSVAINTMWLKQGIDNLSTSVLDLKDENIRRVKENQSPLSLKNNYIYNVQASAAGVKRYSNYILWHIFWNADLLTMLKILHKNIYKELKLANSKKPVT